MPIYEEKDNRLVPFTVLNPGPDLYESEIEELVWNDFEAFVGEALFPIARQAQLPSGGKPDILALDDEGRVVIIEVKRDVDRAQLAQSLEYAGWGRLTNLDELATLYDARIEGHVGPDAFFEDWRSFTDSATPRIVNSDCRLILIARDFDTRTSGAIEFLQEYGVPIQIVPVALYAHATGWRIVSIENDFEPQLQPLVGEITRRQFKSGGRRFAVADLITAGIIDADERVVFDRPRMGTSYSATIRADGQFELSDGSLHRSPSLAAMRAANMVSCDGWYAWRVPRLGNQLLDDLRDLVLSTNGEDDANDLGQGSIDVT